MKLAFKPDELGGAVRFEPVAPLIVERGVVLDLSKFAVNFPSTGVPRIDLCGIEVFFAQALPALRVEVAQMDLSLFLDGKSLVLEVSGFLLGGDIGIPKLLVEANLNLAQFVLGSLRLDGATRFQVREFFGKPLDVCVEAFALLLLCLFQRKLCAVKALRLRGSVFFNEGNLTLGEKELVVCTRYPGGGSIALAF
ncbi:hypothetical protein D9M70_539420 [compost metagenome]